MVHGCRWGSIASFIIVNGAFMHALWQVICLNGKQWFLGTVRGYIYYDESKEFNLTDKSGWHPFRLIHEATTLASANRIYKDLPENDRLNVAFVDVEHASMQVCNVGLKRGLSEKTPTKAHFIAFCFLLLTIAMVSFFFKKHACPKVVTMVDLTRRMEMAMANNDNEPGKATRTMMSTENERHKKNGSKRQEQWQWTKHNGMTTVT
ncbi:hypothetical protein VNO77_23495 [Canavalia gladiata]|uniref:Uncharacterized protein n=1 Tax=Canavalia gladiata TaxID=3824 RepID=A0AAN9L5V7_CANGL